MARTARQKAALRKAQLASARKRKGTGKRRKPAKGTRRNPTLRQALTTNKRQAVKLVGAGVLLGYAAHKARYTRVRVRRRRRY